MLEGSFLSHLVELRARIIRSLGVLLIGFLPCAFFARELYTLLAQPLLEKLPQGGQMIATDVATPFFVPMQVAMMLAFVITLPHTLYQIWAFVAPDFIRMKNAWHCRSLSAAACCFSWEWRLLTLPHYRWFLNS